MVVHGILRTQQDEQEADRKWDLRQVVQHLPLGEADEGHGGLVQIVHTAHQNRQGLGVLRDPTHDVLDVLLAALVRGDPDVDPISMLKHHHIIIIIIIIIIIHLTLYHASV